LIILLLFLDEEKVYFRRQAVAPVVSKNQDLSKEFFTSFYYVKTQVNTFFHVLALTFSLRKSYFLFFRKKAKRDYRKFTANSVERQKELQLRK